MDWILFLPIWALIAVYLGIGLVVGIVGIKFSNDGPSSKGEALALLAIITIGAGPLFVAHWVDKFLGWLTTPKVARND